MSRLQLIPGVALGVSCEYGVFYFEVDTGCGECSPVVVRLDEVNLVALAGWALDENHARILREVKP